MRAMERGEYAEEMGNCACGGDAVTYGEGGVRKEGVHQTGRWFTH